MVVAIDGPAGVGKSTVASQVATRCDLLYISSGIFYRAVAFSHLSTGGDPEDEAAVIRTAEAACFSLDHDGNLSLNDSPVRDEDVRNPEIDMASSRYSVLIPVRKAVNRELRRIAGDIDIIMEGRDITTVVFPDADLKFYFDADLEERAQRRLADYGSGFTFEQFRDDIEKRDIQDKNKDFGALKIAEDAVYIDTSHLTIDEVCDKVVQKILDNKRGSGEY